jgi:Fic family protein
MPLRLVRAAVLLGVLHSGYWPFEFISISDVILKPPKRYYLAFLYTETEENDATYLWCINSMSAKRP